MTEKKEVVKEEASQAAEDSTPKETERGVEKIQAEKTAEESQTVSEDVKTKPDEIARNLQRAIEKEQERLRKIREEIRAAKSERDSERDLERSQPEDYDDEEVVRRFYKAEADAYIARKLAEEGEFYKKIAPSIEAEMSKDPNLTIQQAEQIVKARLFDEAIKDSGETTVKVETNQPQSQPKSTAIPEDEEPETTGDEYRDIIEGKDQSEDARAFRSAIERHAGAALRKSWG